MKLNSPGRTVTGHASGTWANPARARSGKQQGNHVKFLAIGFLWLALGLGLLAPTCAYAAFGLTSDTNFYTVDTGASPNLVFKVRRTDNGSSTQSAGDIASLVYNGVEYQDQSRGSQINGGFDFVYNSTSAVTVSAAVVATNYVRVTVQAGNLTHYYLARKGYANIYMATYFSTEPDTLGLCRYIVRMPSTLVPNGPAPSDIRNTDTTVESGDIFGFGATNANVALRGQTRSKHYSNQRLMDWSTIGATGSNVGVWMIRDNNEGNSGGPFYRSLLNQCGSDQEITYIINYGEAQTEAFRVGVLNGPYVLAFTSGAAPSLPIDTSWIHSTGIDATLTGWVQNRGYATGQATGIPSGFQGVVGFANSTAQYWCTVSNGSYTSPWMIPGTYTMTLYKGELAVATDTVTVPQSVTPVTKHIASTETTPLQRWRIGEWDGTPAGFLNADKVTTMHPSDVRMSAWGPVTYTVGSSLPGSFPCYQWKDVNNPTTIQFELTADQLTAHTLRVGVTCAYAGGRPQVSVNGWTAPAPTASTQPGTRTLTVGTYRGNNKTFTYSIPANKFVVGTNTMTLTVISGSSGTGFLSPGYSYDAVELDGQFNGTYRITPRHAQDKALDVAGGDPGNSAQIDISTYQGEARQQFLLDPQSDGSYRIRTALAGNRCVELPSGNAANGTLIKLWDDNGNDAQRWNIVPVVGPWVKIVPKNDATKCMDVAALSTADGANVQSWDYLGGSNQLWSLTPSDEAFTTNVPNGTYRLTPRHATDKTLDVLNANPNNLAPLAINTSNTATSQKFLLDLQSDGTYRIRTTLTGNRCVELPAGDTTNGTQVQLWDDNGNNAQRWYLIPLGNGWYKIAPKNNIIKSMDVKDFATADGSRVQSWDYLGGANQQWRLDVVPPGIVVTPTTGLTTTEGGGTATFTVELNSQPTADVTVDLSSSDTTEGSLSPASLTFTAANWNAPQTVTVTGVDDAEDDGDIAYSIVTAAATGTDTHYSGLDAADVGLTNTDNDPLLALSINDVTVNESNSGAVNAVFTVTRSGDTSGTSSVHYSTADGTTNPATAGSDYVALADTVLSFAAGDTSKTITVTVNGDTSVELNETFFVNLSTSVGATLSDAQGLGTITNDDIVLPTLAINNVTVTEGNSGTANAVFTVTRSGDTSGTSSVHYATADGTATAPGDYTAVPDTVLSFTPGQTSRTLTVLVRGDAFDEAHETFKVNLFTATGATIATSLGVGTIHDDDPSPIFSINDVTLAEGPAQGAPAGTVDAVFNIVLSAPSNRTVTLTYKTADGTATAGVDYVAHPSTVLTYTPGQTSKTVTVKVNGDTFDEGIETFKVVLQSATFAAIIDNKGAGTITDDDPLPSLAISDAVAVVEGPAQGAPAGSKNALFTVTLTGATNRTVMVNYATSAVTASAGSDYTTKTGTLTFVPGTPTSKTLPIAVLGDTLSEATETFKVNLSVNGTSYATLSDSQGVGTIIDDDALPTLSINDVTVTEGNSSTVNATFTVTLAAVSGQTVSVGYATANGSAVAPGDYTTKAGTLTFAPGETSKTITVAVKGETLFEPNETFSVNLSSPSGASLGDGQGTGTIANDDA